MQKRKIVIRKRERLHISRAARGRCQTAYPWQSATAVDYLPGWRPTGLLVDITEKCNLSCPHCCKLCDQTDSDAHLDVDVFQRLLDESAELDYDWKLFSLFGGEPTMHPKLWDLIERLEQYAKEYPNTCYRVVSNCVGPAAAAFLRDKPAWIFVPDYGDASARRKRHISFLKAPCDVGRYTDAQYAQGCYRPYNCGAGFDVHGRFHVCTVGTTIARAHCPGLGYDSLADLLKADPREDLVKCCRYCGYFNGTWEGWPSRGGAGAISKTWQVSLMKLREQHGKCASDTR